MVAHYIHSITQHIPRSARRRRRSKQRPFHSKTSTKCCWYQNSRKRQHFFGQISQMWIASFYTHTHVSSERNRRRFSALQQPWSCFHALPEGPLSVMLIWQWQMPSRRDYTFLQAPESEPAVLLVILSLCRLVGVQQLVPINPDVLIQPSPFSLVLLHRVVLHLFYLFCMILFPQSKTLVKKNKVIESSLLSEALRLSNEYKPIYFTARWWSPSGCLDFLRFALVLILALIEFRVYLSFSDFFCTILSLSLGLCNVS